MSSEEECEDALECAAAPTVHGFQFEPILAVRPCVVEQEESSSESESEADPPATTTVTDTDNW